MPEGAFPSLAERKALEGWLVEAIGSQCTKLDDLSKAFMSRAVALDEGALGLKPEEVVERWRFTKFGPFVVAELVLGNGLSCATPSSSVPNFVDVPLLSSAPGATKAIRMIVSLYITTRGRHLISTLRNVGAIMLIKMIPKSASCAAVEVLAKLDEIAPKSAARDQLLPANSIGVFSVVVGCDMNDYSWLGTSASTPYVTYDKALLESYDFCAKPAYISLGHEFCHLVRRAVDAKLVSEDVVALVRGPRLHWLPLVRTELLIWLLANYAPQDTFGRVVHSITNQGQNLGMEPQVSGAEMKAAKALILVLPVLDLLHVLATSGSGDRMLKAADALSSAQVSGRLYSGVDGNEVEFANSLGLELLKLVPELGPAADNALRKLRQNGVPMDLRVLSAPPASFLGFNVYWAALSEATNEGVLLKLAAWANVAKTVNVRITRRAISRVDILGYFVRVLGLTITATEEFEISNGVSLAGLLWWITIGQNSKNMMVPASALDYGRMSTAAENYPNMPSSATAIGELLFCENWLRQSAGLAKQLRWGRIAVPANGQIAKERFGLGVPKTDSQYAGLTGGGFDVLVPGAPYKDTP